MWYEYICNKTTLFQEPPRPPSPSILISTRNKGVWGNRHRGVSRRTGEPPLNCIEEPRSRQRREPFYLSVFRKACFRCLHTKRRGSNQRFFSSDTTLTLSSTLTVSDCRFAWTADPTRNRRSSEPSATRTARPARFPVNRRTPTTTVGSDDIVTVRVETVPAPRVPVERRQTSRRSKIFVPTVRLVPLHHLESPSSAWCENADCLRPHTPYAPVWGGDST